MNQSPLCSHKTEIKLKCFEIDTFGSNTSEDTVSFIAPIYPVTNNSFSDTDVILDSSAV